MRIEGMLPQQILQILSKSILESLDIGDFIQGRVTSVKDGLAQVKLMDGSSFTAGIPEDMLIQEGALLTLQVSDKTNDRITAKIVNNNDVKAQPPAAQDLPAQARSQLEAFGGKATEALVSKIVDLVESNPSLGVEKASFLVANQMEPDKGMQDIIMKLAQKEFQVDRNLASLKDQLISMLTEPETTGSGKSVAEAVIRPLIVEQGLERMVAGLADQLVETLNQTAQDGKAGGNPLLQAGQKEEVKQTLNENLLRVLKDAVLEGKPLERASVLDMIKTALEGIKLNKSAAGAETVFKLPANLSEDILPALITGLEDVKEKAVSAQKPDPATVRQIVEKVFEKAFIKVDNGVSGQADITEKVNAIKDVLTLANDAMKLTDPKSAQAGLPVVHELQNALQFFNQANTYHTFVQIPLMINNHQTTGELYIMKGKSRRGRIDPNRFTLFISLNTQNLGLVETFLNATNRCVTVNFRVEDEKLANFLKSNYRVLYEALNNKGYKLADMKCRLHTEDGVNLLNAERKTEEALGLNARIDLKL